MEDWRIIEDECLPSKWEINSIGKVRRISDKVLKVVNDNGNGYLKYAFSVANGKLVNRYVHRLVAKAFIPNPENLPQVGHKDHDQSNNCVENLYWTTQSQNTRDGVEAGRINAVKRGITNQLRPDDIRSIAKQRFAGTGVVDIARAMKLPRTTVSSVLNGRSYWSIFDSEMQRLAALEQTGEKPVDLNVV